MARAEESRAKRRAEPRDESGTAVGRDLATVEVRDHFTPGQSSLLRAFARLKLVPVAPLQGTAAIGVHAQFAELLFQFLAAARSARPGHFIYQQLGE